MKTCMSVMMAVCMASAMPLFAQSADEPGRDGRRPEPTENPAQGSESMTEEQTNQVQQILSRYDAGLLDEEMAQAIHGDFREAGLRGGPATADAIRAAGFDPDQLRDLAPPPDASPVKGPKTVVKEPKTAGKGDRSRGSDRGRAAAIRSSRRSATGPNFIRLHLTAWPS